MRHRLSGEYTSVGNLKMDWGQGRRKGVLGALIERLFYCVATSRRNVRCDAHCLKGASITTIVSQGETVISARF